MIVRFCEGKLSMARHTICVLCACMELDMHATAAYCKIAIIRILGKEGGLGRNMEKKIFSQFFILICMRSKGVICTP